MILSPSQVNTFWRLWAAACKARGWTREAGLSTKEIDGRRKDLLKACGFSSLTLVDRTDGFTKVKNELEVLVGVSVKAGMEASDPLLNKARNLRYVIRNEILPCLALYEEDPSAYLASIITDIARWNKIDRPGRAVTLDDLDAQPITKIRQGAPHESPSHLHQAMMTLNARLHDKRNAAGHSLHDMKTQAGLKCGCKECARAALQAHAPAGKEKEEEQLQENPF